jgi:ABC-type dipeptide/oligopeptide/nickel transport system permease subunit
MNPLIDSTDLNAFEETPRKHPLQLFWSRLKKRKMTLLGAALVVLFLVLASGAHLMAPHDPFKQDLRHRLEGPSEDYPMGRDDLGRCILSRVIYGARTSLYIGVSAIGIGLSIGVLLGAVAGYYRRIDGPIMRMIDIMLAFPTMFLALAIVSMLGPGLNNVIVAVGIYSVPTFCRITRGSVLAVKEIEFIEAARAIGAGDATIIFGHILPNCLAPLIVQTTLYLPAAIITAAGLSFLGLGVQSPIAEWGAMLGEGRVYLQVAPHVAVFPGLAIMIVVFGFNLLGDGLRDILDPRLH